MLYEILPDPLALLGAKGNQVLNIHRIIPESVPVGHFEQDGTEVVDEVVRRPDFLDRIRRHPFCLGTAYRFVFATTPRKSSTHLSLMGWTKLVASR